MASSNTKESRRKPRYERKAKVKIHWHDAQGVLKSAVGVCQDISRTGMLLTLDKPIPDRMLVNLQCAELRLVGNAVVRHCRRAGLNDYSAGCEFAGGMEWRQAD